MPVFKLPLSGDVVQNISPFTAFMSPIGSQFGLINSTVGQSSAPEVESEVLSDVGTYGKQLGQIGDALLVLIERMPKEMQLDGDPRRRRAEGNAAPDLRHQGEARPSGVAPEFAWA